MLKPPLPSDEPSRIRALHRYDVLYTAQEETFDRITRIASVVAGAPISLVSLIDEERQWFKSRVGLDASETPRDISFCGHAILGNAPLIVPDATKDDRFCDNPLVTDGPAIRLYAGMPLTVAGVARLGTLCVIDTVPRQLSEAQVAALSDLAAVTVHELEMRRGVMTDFLTGAFNRPMLAKISKMELSRARRHQEYFSFAVLDLDHFRLVNDTFGHAVGDAVLVQVSTICKKLLKPEDSFFRLGGEEFGILLANTGLQDALPVMERILREIKETPVEAEGHSVKVTASIGLTEYWPGEESFDEIILRADNALNEAKEAGRNVVIVG